MSSGPQVWLDGRLRPAAEARIDPADRGFLLGDGLFETMRAVGGRVPLLARHLARLGAGCALLGIPAPAAAAVATAATTLLAANGMADAALRLTVTRGPGPRGLLPLATVAPTLLLAAFPLPAPALPRRAVVARTTCRNERSPLSGVKALGYLDQILALKEAVALGAEEAILLNGRGRLACASAANLFLVRGRELLTPAVAEGALPGVTRGLVLELAGGLGLAAREAVLEPSLLGEADELFTTSSLALLTPLGVPGPVAVEVMAALRRAAGA